MILPVMLALLLGALDLGRVFYANITMTSAAKEAALRASTGASDWAAAGVNEARGGFVTVAAGDVTAVYSDAGNKCSSSAAFGATVTATVTGSFRAITPYVGALLGSQDKALTATATAYCAVPPPPAAAAPSASAPSSCTVPDMTAIKNGRYADALAAWTAAGFTGALTDNTGKKKVGTQSPSPNSMAPCTSSGWVGP